MKAFHTDDFSDHSCDVDFDFEKEDYEADKPRWCKGCGDLSILTTVQSIFAEEQVDPKDVACISGIGCSSRFPYYLKTYGFHGIHGRALPISTGVSIARPDLNVLTVMGDGDCFSIGAGHWLHAIRYNVNLTALVFDNKIYALTKKQVSPTTNIGTSTNTTPRGAYLEAMNPLSVMLGIANLSFLAQTATWLPTHLSETIKAAWKHKGLAFVRILQRCPIFSADTFTDPEKGNVDLKILKNEHGIPTNPSLEKVGTVIEHDHHDLSAARDVVHRKNNPGGTEIMGLIYRNNDIPLYNDIRSSSVIKTDPKSRMEKLNSVLDEFAL